jgi:hypothetical protein
MDKVWSQIDMVSQMIAPSVDTALEVIDIACKLNCQSRRDADKTFLTSKKSTPSGGVYSGRTSGRGSQEQILTRRDSSHHVREVIVAEESMKPENTRR